MNEIDKARQIILNNDYMTIATADLDGTPWVSPVFFVFDEKLNLIWVSNKDARHSKLIRKNSRVAIVIFDSKAQEGAGDAVYIEATARELVEDGEIEAGMKVRLKRETCEEFRVNSISDVKDDKSWRMYCASPNKVYKLSESRIGGQLNDVRMELALESLIQSLQV